MGRNKFRFYIQMRESVEALLVIFLNEVPKVFYIPLFFVMRVKNESQYTQYNKCYGNIILLVIDEKQPENGINDRNKYFIS
jgi:hypothetical protein